MTAPLPIIARLLAVESGDLDFIGNREPQCVTCWHRNPDGPDGARIIEELYEALKALRGNIGAASLVRNELGKELRANADAALAKARGESA